MHPLPLRRRPWSAAGFVSLLLLIVVAGCGPAKGKVSGQVLLDGSPVPGGWVTFQPAGGKYNSVSVELDEQGRFVAELPAGDVTVCVDNRELEPRAEQTGPTELPPELKDKIRPPKPTKGRPKASPRYVPLPPRYYDAQTSGLSFRVRGGAQTEDIHLSR